MVFNHGFIGHKIQIMFNIIVIISSEDPEHQTIAEIVFIIMDDQAGDD